jgi:Domain of unknown function (DUF1887)
MQNPQWLAIGLSTLISGTLTSVALSASNPTLPIAASTTGAISVSLFTKRKEDRMKEETLQHNEELRQNNEQLRHNNEQLRHNIANLESLLAKYPATLTPVIQQDLPPKTETKNAPVEVLSEHKLENNSNAIAWLQSKNFQVESYYQSQETVDRVSQKIATFLGERYSSLKNLYNCIKSNTNTGSQFRLKLGTNNQKDISDCTSFCQFLSEHSFLAKYRYLSNEKTIIATPQTSGKVSNFLQGGWFECFIYQQVCKLLSHHQLNYEVLMNVKGTYANDNGYELDLFFLINDRPLWIECKAGKDYNAYLTKYCQYRKKLGIAKERAFLVILELSDRQTVNYTALWDITVANLNNFIPKIENVLGLSNRQEIQPNDEISEQQSNTAFKILKNKSLRPSPECRIQVIEHIVKLFAESDRDLLRDQICEEIHKNLSISKSKIDEIIRTLMHSQSFLDSSGNFIASLKDPIAKLVSSDWNVLNQKCIEFYRKVILTSDPSFFDNPENVKDFDDTVG